MIEWYYHEPGAGRAGPFSAGDLRRHLAERRIQADTLVWHHGLREWQPLERMAAEIGLDGLHVDSARPPPLPAQAGMSPPGSAAPRATPRGKYSRNPLQQKKTLPPAAVVLIVAAALGIPGVLVLGSVALPAYQDYAWRVTRMGALEGLADGLKQVAGDFALQTGRCLRNDDPRMATLRREVRRRFSTRLSFATIEGGCAFELAIDADGRDVDGKTLRYRGYRGAAGFAWECTGGTLPDEYRPAECRNRG